MLANWVSLASGLRRVQMQGVMGWQQLLLNVEKFLALRKLDGKPGSNPSP